MPRGFTPVFIAVLAVTCVFAEDPVRLPGDIPPVIGMAIAAKSSKVPETGYQLEIVFPVVTYEIESGDGNLGKVAKQDVVVSEVRSVTRTLDFETNRQIQDSKVVDIDGAPLDMETVLRRLKKRTPILVSVSGRMIDPYYLQLANPEAVIVILSGEDGRGDWSLLPTPKNPESKPAGPESQRISEIVQLEMLKTTDAVFGAAKRFQPILLKTRQQAEPYFQPQSLKFLDQRVDFNKQYVLVFAWRGSGQDRLTHEVSANSGEGEAKIEFLLIPGRTRDLRSHVSVFAVRNDVIWEMLRSTR